MLPHLADQGRDDGALIETRDHHRACRRSRHVSNLRQIPQGIETKAARVAGISAQISHQKKGAFAGFLAGETIRRTPSAAAQLKVLVVRLTLSTFQPGLEPDWSHPRRHR